MDNIELIKLRENANHGDFMLPFATYSGWMSPSYKSVPLHWHKEMEITLIEEGTAYYNIDLENYEFSKGNILFIHPHRLHSLNYENNIPMKWSTIVFNLDMLKSFSSDAILIKYLSPLINREHSFPLYITDECSGYEEILKTFKQLIRCYTEKYISYELEIKSLLIKLLGILYRNNLIIKDSIKANSTQAVDKIKISLNYIHNNYDKQISIKSLAELCSFSEYYFMRFFKKHVGMSCIQYINSYRLEKASQLLLNTSKSILDISFDVGFDNLSYFIKLFKQKYNITPKQFRKNSLVTNP